jgi:hypothetical protein
LNAGDFVGCKSIRYFMTIDIRINLLILPKNLDERRVWVVKIALTGIKPTGIPHIGNYLGMIKNEF